MTYFEDESYILNGNMTVDKLVYDKKDCENIFEPCYKKIEVEIMQYTGLKDKNGKEIYEGDIIQDEFYERKAEVVFLEGAFWLDYKEDFGVYNTKHKRYQLLANYDYEQVLEVIGNIYDNKELLEEE
jgi:uncharacterized phage protein (TIGR01671 family)